LNLDTEFDVDKEFETLITTLGGWLSPEEVGLVERAFVFARQRHGDQKRASGGPYMLHPVKAALVLADYRMMSWRTHRRRPRSLKRVSGLRWHRWSRE
jgi:GTP pyrophosphokinase